MYTTIQSHPLTEGDIEKIAEHNSSGTQQFSTSDIHSMIQTGKLKVFTDMAGVKQWFMLTHSDLKKDATLSAMWDAITSPDINTFDWLIGYLDIDVIKHSGRTLYQVNTE